MKYKAKVKDYRLVVTARAGFGEKIDENALNKFTWANPAGFMKANQVRRNCIEFTGSNGISLEEYLYRPMKGHDFLFLMEQLSLAIRSVMGKKLSQSKVVLDVAYAYINNTTRELQLLYVPADYVNFSNGIMSFIDDIIDRARPDTEADRMVIAKFHYFLRQLNGYDPERVEQYIRKTDPKVIKTILSQHTGMSQQLIEVQDRYDRDFKNVPMDADDQDARTALMRGGYDYDDEATNILVEDEATGLLGEDEDDIATGLLAEDEDDIATGLLAENDDDIATGLLVEEEQPLYPKLYRIDTEETITVDQSVFRIGRKSSSDYRVTDNDKISGKHIDIYSRGGRYSVVDLGSKNGTYLNDQMITPGEEMELRDGDRLRLANEVFLFNE